MAASVKLGLDPELSSEVISSMTFLALGSTFPTSNPLHWANFQKLMTPCKPFSNIVFGENLALRQVQFRKFGCVWAPTHCTLADSNTWI